MKLFSLAVIALSCATIVSCAPSTHNPSFEEISDLNPFAAFDKLKDYWVNIKCVRDVISQVMEESEVKEMWTEAKSELNKIVEVEWPRCLGISDKVEQEKCKVTCIENGIHVVTGFLTTLFSEHKLDLVHKIRTEITSQCFSEHDEIGFRDTVDATANPPLIEQFQCLVDTLSQVSKDIGLEELWDSTGTEIEQQLDSWRECSNLENRFAIIFCNVKEGVRTYKLVIEYVRTATAEKPEFANRFVTEFRRNCAATSSFVLLESFRKDDDYKNIEHLKCIVDATNAAVKETDFEKIWEEYRSDIEKAFQRVKACKTQVNKWEAAKCVAKEIYGSYEIFTKFTNKLKQANYETYTRVKKYIKERCYQ